MKTIKILIALMLMLTLNSEASLPKLAVISFDANAAEFDQQSLTELLRIEISKHQKYEMVDRYQIQELLSAQDINSSSCFSKACIQKAAEILKVDWAVSASVDKIGEALFINIRMMDSKTGIVEKNVVKEFLFIPKKINTMITICVNELMGVANDQLTINSLSNAESYESAVNNPYYQTLSLAGPRMGYTFFVGDQAEILKKPKSEGGFDAYPAFFQMGYQFEKQYLNEGKFQALFEFIPMVSGLDQGLIIPSLTILNGLRNNKNGLEFAIGPSVNIVKQTQKYKNKDGVWVRDEDVSNVDEEPTEYITDSRGIPRLNSYVVIAAGFSIRSGKLNIPINAFVVPSKKNLRFGFSFGFNAKN